jgi:hypothetical protein
MQNLTTLNVSWLGSLGPVFGIFLITAMIVMHVLFAVCIKRDADLRRIGGRPLVLLTPFVWALAALLLGLVGVAFYWVCHHSRFYRIEK